MVINNKYYIIDVIKHQVHDSSKGELIKPQKAPNNGGIINLSYGIIPIILFK